MVLYPCRKEFMTTEKQQISKVLRKLFESASDIYVDTKIKECEVRVDIDEFQGEINGRLHEGNVWLEMVDYIDIYPYKYVFSYKTR